MKERQTLLQFDFEWNNKLLNYQSVTWKTPSTASKTRNGLDISLTLKFKFN